MGDHQSLLYRMGTVLNKKEKLKRLLVVQYIQETDMLRGEMSPKRRTTIIVPEFYANSMSFI